jgi:c-di-GMP-related signal transduction protein
MANKGVKDMDVYVARQPIFNKQKKVIGYELLYRSGLQNFFDHNDGDRATSDVITNSFSVIGLEVLTGGKRAFINFTENLLKSDIASILPPDLIAVEILEDIRPDKEIIEICKKLKRLSYILVLDDFVAIEQITPLIEFADIIKVDFLKTNVDQRKQLIKDVGTDHVKFLAEKVETEEEFSMAAEMGYSYFQGYFFSKPTIYKGRDLPSYKLNYLRIIQEVNQPEISFNQLEAIIKQDLSLSYKLLRLINSAAFGFNTKITSIKYALVLLGIKEFVRWITVIALRGMGDDKPDELIVASLIRAKYAENLAPKLGLYEQASDLFLMGLFSLMDALLDRPIGEILNELPISPAVKGAILGTEKNIFRNVYELVVAYEQGLMTQLDNKNKLLGIEESELARLYINSIHWVNQIFNYS